jgi:ribosome maturation protein SDO1
MISLEDAVVARYESHGERFEVLVDPDEIQPFKEGKIDTLTLASDFVFTASKKSDKGSEKQLMRKHGSGIKGGLHTEKASEESLMKVFGTTDVNEVAARIVRKGEIQLTTEQRRHMLEEKRKKIVNIISRNAINPQTKLPHPPARIELAMDEAKVNVEIFKSAEEQINNVVKALRPLIPIKFENVKLAVCIPPEYAGKVYNEVHGYGRVVKEEWQSNGSYIAVIEMPAGMKGEFLDHLGSKTHGQMETRILNSKI